MSVNLILFAAILAENIASATFSDVFGEMRPVIGKLDAPLSSITNELEGVRIASEKKKSFRSLGYPVKEERKKPDASFSFFSASSDEEDGKSDEENELRGDGDQQVAFSLSKPLEVPGVGALKIPRSASFSRSGANTAEMMIGEYVIKLFVDKSYLLKFTDYKHEKGVYKRVKNEDDAESSGSEDSSSDSSDSGSAHVDFAPAREADSGSGDEDGFLFANSDGESPTDMSSESSGDDSEEESGGESLGGLSDDESGSFENDMAYELQYAVEDVFCAENIHTNDNKLFCGEGEAIKILVLKKRYSNMVPFSALLDMRTDLSDLASSRVGLQLLSAHVDQWETIGRCLLAIVERMHDENFGFKSLDRNKVYVYNTDEDQVTSESLKVAISDVREAVYATQKNADYDQIEDFMFALLEDSGMEDNEGRNKISTISGHWKNNRKIFSLFRKRDGSHFLGGFTSTHVGGMPIILRQGGYLNFIVDGIEGPLKLTSPIYDDAETVYIFGAKDRSGRKFVVKVEFIFKDMVGERCAMDNEGEFIEAVKESGEDLSSKIVETYLVSNPGQFFLGRSFYHPKEDLVILVGTPVRIEIMERLGLPLMKMKQSVKAHLKQIARQGLNILKSIHRSGFVHGDVHEGNFVDSGERLPDGTTPIIKAIDFGQSVRFKSSSQPGEHPVVDATLKFLSISELESFFPAPKDDLFRWGETLLNIITDDAYFLDMPKFGTEESLTAAANKAFIEYKLKYLDSFSSEASAALIQNFMRAVLALDYSAKPGEKNYEEVIEFFD